MSLLVNLPLNGSLENIGLTNYTVTNNNCTISNLGKIGKCYDFSDGNYLTLNATSAKLFQENSSFSLCLWVLSRSKPTAQTGLLCSNNYRICGIGIGYRTNGNLIVMIMNNSTSNEADTGYTLPLNEWHHISLTYDNLTNKYSFYVDGLLIKSEINSFNWLPGPLSFLIGRNTQGGWPGNFNGLINDVRIYDHCLSLKEIKDISKCLMIHYPLNHNGFGNKNLQIGTDSYPDSAWLDKASVTVSKNVAIMSRASYPKLKGISVLPNEVYTISLDIKADVEKTPSAYGVILLDYLDSNNNRAAYEWVKGTFKTTWQRMHYTATVPNNSNIKYLSIGFRNTENVNSCYFRFLKVEYGDKATPWCPNENDTLYSTMGLDSTTEYDTSGFKYNGVSSTNITWSSDSPIYSGSYLFTNKEYITIPQISYENMDYGTVSFWLKINDYNAWDHYFGINNGFNWTSQGKDFIIVAKTANNSTNHSVRLDCCSKGYTFTPVVDTWYHIAFTWDAVNYVIKYYLNGNCVYTFDDSTDKRLDTYRAAHTHSRIGNFTANSSDTYKANCNISDFRLYATALSDDDIINLYNVHTSLAKNGTLLVSELNEEENSTTKVNITGVTTTSTYESVEDSSLKVFSNSIVSNDLNEI